MTSALYIELCAAGVVLLILMLTDFGNPGAKMNSQGQRLFNAIAISIIVVLVSEAVCWAVDGRLFNGAREINTVFNFIYYISQPVVCFAWFIYSDYKVYGNARRVVKLAPVAAIPLIVSIIMSTVNLFIPYIYEVDKYNLYKRGDYFVFSLLISLVYLVLATVDAFIGTRDVRVSERRTLRRFLLIFPLPPVIGLLIQTFFYGFSLLWLCATFSLLVIYVNVQNQQVTTDALTGLNNRRRFEIFLDAQLRTDISEHDLMFLVMIDIDGFKKINDTYGHAEGDEALRLAANVFRSSIGRGDFLARFAGDEFVIVGYRHCEDDAKRLIYRINDNFDYFNKSSDKPYKLGVSTGMAFYPKDTEEGPDDLLRIADKRMYENKVTRKVTR